MKHVRYQSLGNSVGIEEVYDDYWELADNGHVVRSVHVLQDGSRLRYDEEHPADRFGVLPEGRITEELLEDSSLGTITVINEADFEAQWAIKAKNERIG